MENKTSNFLIDFGEFDPFATLSSFPNDANTMTKIMDVDFSHQVTPARPLVRLVELWR